MGRDELEGLIRTALTKAWRKDIPCPADFDEAAYLAAWPDLATAIEEGKIRSAFVHFVTVGRSEGRPRPSK